MISLIMPYNRYFFQAIFQKRINIIQYRKIQYIDIKQGPVSKSLGLNHGEIYILAGSAVNDKVIDYYDEKIFNELVDKI